jgi:ATP adenylyltransferase
MDHLWTPWRFRYVSQTPQTGKCAFCELARQDPSLDEASYVLFRACHNFVFLNIYPYTTGHLLVAPYAHVASLNGLDGDALSEMMSLARRAEAALGSAYRAEGYNMGMNLGRCAGAGVADHLHLHFLPRWVGDSSFVSVVGETRVIPEDLAATYSKLAPLFRKM